MDTLRNYLNTMFESLPDTPDVRRAKDELWQMMEDKYMDLTADGASPNEALGTVISEFGSLDDFADMLGIRSLVPVGGDQESTRGSGSVQTPGSAQYYRPVLQTQEAETYLKEMTKISMIDAVGVASFIYSICAHTVFGELADHLSLFQGIFGLIENLLFFGLILFGVLCVIYADSLKKKWKFIFKRNCILSPDAELFTENRFAQIRGGITRFRTAGIILCAICWLPAAILDSISHYLFSDIVAPTLLFILVGTGVGLLIMTGGIEDAHKKLLKKCHGDRNRG